MLELDAITTLALASVLYLVGIYIINHVGILKRLCIPAPVIGGLLFAIIVAILETTGLLTIKLDSDFIQDFFMLAFFTTIGLGASFKLLRLGGKSQYYILFLWCPSILSKHHWCITGKIIKYTAFIRFNSRFYVNGRRTR